MRRAVTVLAIAAAVVVVVGAATPPQAQDLGEAAPSARLYAPQGATEDEPIFVRWLDPAVPGDQVIRAYWERAAAGTASPSELVDLGTMLFYRGFPKDAERTLRSAVKLIRASDPPPEAVAPDVLAAEAYFRIGFINHTQGQWGVARDAYGDCLDVLTGHGWCNFYRGRLAEQEGQAEKAIHFYRRAFKFAPQLADPEVNPEVLYSRLDLAALIPRLQRSRFVATAPWSYLEPERVSALLLAAAPAAEPTPTPTPPPEPTPTPPPLAAEEGVPLAATPTPTPELAPTAAPPTPTPTEAERRRRERIEERRQRVETSGRGPRVPEPPGGRTEPTPPPPAP